MNPPKTPAAMVAADRRRTSALPHAGRGRVARCVTPDASPNARVVAGDGRPIPCDTLDRLERLDDTVFAALAGDPQALDAAADAWREAADAVDRCLLDETRQHYVQRARSRWRRVQQEPDDRLTVGFAAEELLRLFGE